MGPTTTPAPDPAVTTAPQSATPAAETPPGEWDFLDLQEDQLPDDPLEFREDREAREAREAEEEAKKIEEAPVTEEVETKPAEAVTEEVKTPEVDPEILRKAQEYDNFDKTAREQPELLAQVLLEKLNPKDRLAILKQFGAVEPDRVQFDPDSYETDNEFERALKDRWDDIEVIPQIIQQTQSIEQGLQQTHDLFIPHIAEANVSAQIALYKIDAICQALGIDLSDPSMEDINKALQNPDVTYRDAVRKSKDYSKSVQAQKQKTAPRPVTPGNESAHREPYKPGTSMEEIMRDMGVLPRR